MSRKRYVLHAGIVLALLTVSLVIPSAALGVFARMAGDTDANSSATLISDKPTGEYLVFINETRHPDTVDTWVKFFEGGEITFLFDDLDGYVMNGDVSGLEMAQNYQTRLPANQLRLKAEDGTLLVSKAENLMFDVLVLSKEAAQSCCAETLSGIAGIRTVYVRGK